MSRLRRQITGLNHAAERLGVSHAGNPNERWPNASTVQSLLFARKSFTPFQARSWARRHGFGHRKVDATGANVRIRQADPSQFTDFRTITLTDGVQAIVGPRR